MTLERLSGGEKSVAALSLALALNSTFPSPLYMFDEVDAALDTSAVARVSAFFASQSKSRVQIIVVSLRPELYEKSPHVVGVFVAEGTTRSVSISNK